MELKIPFNQYSDFLTHMMMPEKFCDIEGESSYKEQAYKKHLQRLRNHLSEDAFQSETKSGKAFESENIRLIGAVTKPIRYPLINNSLKYQKQ